MEDSVDVSNGWNAMARLLFRSENEPKPLKCGVVRGAYHGRHGGLHVVSIRGAKGKPALRYVTAGQLAKLGLSLP